MEDNTRHGGSRVLLVLGILLMAAGMLSGLAWGGYTLYSSRQASEQTVQAPPLRAEEELVEADVPLAPPEPALIAQPGYMICEDGLFRPEAPLLPSEAARALAMAAGLSIEIPEEDEALTEESFARLLQQAFSTSRVMAAMDSISLRGDSTVTRAEAAVCLNLLLELPENEGEDFFPDVEPGYWAEGAIRTAGRSTVSWEGEDGRPAPGLLFSRGRLYYAGENGYFLKNTFVKTLRFGPDGKYTSGSRELDGYVEDVLASVTDESMTREEMLRAAFDYVRDNFTYLKRNYYKTGDVGWQLQEALTMFSTGEGNCYCYASAFWSLSRGLGYDAKIVSGTCGGGAPHGWVEIITDGQRLTYDVELEMVQRNRENNPYADFFAMTDKARAKQNYIELPYSDNLVPRDTNEGLQPG